MAHRVLVVANGFIQGAPETLPDDVRAQFEQASEVRFVTPALTGRLEWLVSDVDPANAEADERLSKILKTLSNIDHHPASGGTGDENQLVAIDDALSEFDADAIVVVAHQHGQDNWHEHGVLEDARERFGRPVFSVLISTDGQV